MNLPLRLSTETLAMMIVGDGVLMATQPRRHISVWRVGPEPVKQLIDGLRDRPRLTAALGLAQIAAGLYLASRVKPTFEQEIAAGTN